MQPPSPARLYATLAGAVLFAAGLLGFFQGLSWLNYLYLGTGVLGLLLAGAAPRPYALLAGIAFAVLAALDFSDRGWAHLAVGLLGLVAFAGTPRAGGAKRRSRRLRRRGRSRGRRSDSRAQAAAESP